MDDGGGGGGGGSADRGGVEESQVKAIWQREFWSDEAAAALKGIVGNEVDMIERVNQGKVDLFRVSAPDYQGFGITELCTMGGVLVCKVIAYAGRGTKAAMADLRGLAAAAGCKKMVCSSKQPGIWKLHQRNGWREYERHFEMDLTDVRQ